MIKKSRVGMFDMKHDDKNPDNNLKSSKESTETT